MSAGSREIETAFIIRAERSREIARSVADLRSLGPFSLIPRTTLTLRDTYFDSPDKRLRSAKLALRTRTVGSDTLIALKGDPRPGAHGGEDRLEIEEPFSERSFLTIAEEMQRLGVSLDIRPASGPDIIQKSGLRKIQERETQRQVRDVIDPRSRNAFAEIAVDLVHYLLPGRRTGFHEIEIEARGNDENIQRTMKDISDELMKKFSSSLVLWPYNKLITGNAIRDLLAEDPQWTPGGSDDLLGPRDIDRIASLLHTGRA
jgi:inorganic triphosphatase YgiF